MKKNNRWIIQSNDYFSILLAPPAPHPKNSAFICMFNSSQILLNAITSSCPSTIIILSSRKKVLWHQFPIYVDYNNYLGY